MWERYVGRYLRPAGELWQKLTPSQRLTLVVLGGTICVGLCVVAFVVDHRSYVALARHRDPVRLQSMAVQLERAGYAVRLAGGELQVPEDELPRALSYVAGEVGAAPRRDGWAWLDKEPSWGETSVRQREKKLRARTINLEESVKVCPDIVDALVVLNVKDTPFTVLDAGEEQNSASVTVTLAPGVGRLRPEQVRVIRNIVSGGAPVPYGRVTVTDNRLNMYPLQEEEEPGVAGLDERRRAQIKDYRNRIASYLEQTFRPGEYSLFVDLKLQRERVASQAETIEPPKKPLLTQEVTETEKGRRQIGGTAPGTKANVSARLYQPGETPQSSSSGEMTTVDIEDRQRTERTYAALVSKKREERRKPAGGIERISVAVRLDKDALERVVSRLRGILLKEGQSSGDRKSRSELESAVKDYLAECQKEIATMLQLHGQVDVSVRRDVLLARAAAAVGPVRTGQGILRWAQEHALLVVLVVLGLAALGLVYSLARRSIPPPVEIPPLEVPEEEAVGAAEVQAEKAQEEEIPELRLEDEGFTVSVEQVEQVAREKPQVAAAVVKMWMASEGATKPKDT